LGHYQTLFTLIFMRTMFGAVAALFFSCQVAVAQDAKLPEVPAQVEAVAAKGGKNQSPTERATKTASKLTQKLGLSADQQKEVYAAFLNQFEKVEALRAKNDLRGKVGAIRQETDGKLKSILGEAKYAQYQAMRNEGKERRESKLAAGK
jgi:periplasmic protein CpxP/Spy